jgi:hypothetical protein
VDQLVDGGLEPIEKLGLGAADRHQRQADRVESVDVEEQVLEVD